MARRLLKISCIFAVVALSIYLWLRFYSSIDQKRQSAHHDTANITADCACIDKNSGSGYDFCYASPIGNRIRGRRFSCDWLPILKSIDLLDSTDSARIGHDFIREQDIVFVTAASQWHFGSVLAAIGSVQKYVSSTQRVLFYDLGLNSTNTEFIRRLCGVDYRKLDFKKYPEWVRNLHEFRWKALIIAEALKEFKMIWYMDSSIRMENGNLSEVYSLFNCQLDQRKCNKFPYLLHGGTGHGIFTVTDPGLYNYFPTNIDRLKNRTCQMFEAGFAFIIRTRRVVQEILKWYVLCALERDCMGPHAAVGACEFNAVDRYAKYAKCHRFDQSVLNLLLANLLDFDSSKWSIGVSSRFYRIERHQGLSSEDKELLKFC